MQKIKDFIAGIYGLGFIVVVAFGLLNDFSLLSSLWSGFTWPYQVGAPYIWGDECANSDAHVASMEALRCIRQHHYEMRGDVSF